MALPNKEQHMASVDLQNFDLEMFKEALAKLSPEEKRALAKDIGLSTRKVQEAPVAPADLNLEDAKVQYLATMQEARDSEAISREKRNGARVALELYRQVAEREGEPLTIVRGRVKGLNTGEDEGDEGDESDEG